MRLLFGYPAGNDTVVRVLADKLSELWKQPVIVENITGATGNLAADRTAKAAPDGYTIGVLGSSIAINPNPFSKLPFDPEKDLIPITKIFTYPNVLAINNDVPARSVADLVALARGQPGKLSFGHAGPGSTMHLSGELLKMMARIEMQQVPYRGIPIPDLVAGRISMAFAPPGQIHALSQEGKVRLLAVTSAHRWPYLPDLPTMKESGFPDFEVTTWFGAFVPTGTPPTIIEKIHRDIAKALALPDVRKRFEDLNLMPITTTPTEFAKIIKMETTIWARVIKETGTPIVE